MKAKNCLIFGGSGQIGLNLIRKLTKNNYIVTVVTRNIHQKGYKIKTQANAGYINIVEANIFDEAKIRGLFSKTDICINLVGILYESKKGNTFENIHSIFPSVLAKLCKEYNVEQFIHLSALGIDSAFPIGPVRRNRDLRLVEVLGLLFGTLRRRFVISLFQAFGAFAFGASFLACQLFLRSSF